MLLLPPHAWSGLVDSCSSPETDDCVTWTLNDKICSIYHHKMYCGLTLSLWMRNISPQSSLSSTPNSVYAWSLASVLSLDTHPPSFILFLELKPSSRTAHRIYSPASQSKTFTSTLIPPFTFLPVREDQMWVVLPLLTREVINLLTLNYGHPSYAAWWVGTHGRRVANQRRISSFARYRVVATPTPANDNFLREQLGLDCRVALTRRRRR